MLETHQPTHQLFNEEFVGSDVDPLLQSPLEHYQHHQADHHQYAEDDQHQGLYHEEPLFQHFDGGAGPGVGG